MFGARPYSAVSTTDLAKEAGVARGLINHYFGTKRDLYLVVVRQMMTVPPLDQAALPTGSLRERAAAGVDWLLSVMEHHGRTWVAVSGAEGVGDDPEVQRILDEADDAAAQRVLALVGLVEAPRSAELAAMIRAYGGMVKAAGREWIVNGTLTGDHVRMLLVDLLVTLVGETFPRLGEISA